MSLQTFRDIAGHIRPREAPYEADLFSTLRSRHNQEAFVHVPHTFVDIETFFASGSSAGSYSRFSVERLMESFEGRKPRPSGEI